MAALNILCLVGSPVDAFFCELSELYTRGCLAALNDPSRYAFTLAHVSPGAVWRLPASLDLAAIEAAQPLDFPGAVSALSARRLDVGLPQMFCRPGMTAYRALFELLGLPYLGNAPEQMALTADKWAARAVVAAAGVAVPRGERLTPGMQPTMAPPCVVKPVSADNSDGVTFVQGPAEFPDALAVAFKLGDAAIVEAYVPLGREVRCGVLERHGSLQCLPLEEYYVDAAARPIRRRVDKLKRDAEGGLTLAAKTQHESWIVPAHDPIVPAVYEAARRCHIALGCRHYSLFDFRIDDAGRPWFLEAGLYCSFSPQSVIVTMAAAAGISAAALFDGIAAEALLTAPDMPTRFSARSAGAPKLIV